MKKTLLLFASIAFICLLSSSCRHERVYFHNKNGKIKHRRAARYPPWFQGRDAGYDKRTRRVMRRWDNMR